MEIRYSLIRNEEGREVRGEGKTVIEIWAKDKLALHKDNIQISDICKLKLKRVMVISSPEELK